MSKEFVPVFCSRFRLLVIPLTLFAGVTGGAADNAEVRDQLAEPTHRQVRLIEPKIDGVTPKLHTIATTPGGHLLAAVGGQSIQYVRKDSGYETKLLQEPQFLLMFDSDGHVLKRWPLELTPTALAVAPDGTIYVAGSGRIAKLGEDGDVVQMVDSPHLGDVKELRKKAADNIRQTRSRMSGAYSQQIEKLRERIDEIESKNPDDWSRLEEAQSKAFQTQLETLERLAGPSDKEGEEEDQVVDAQLDMAVMRAMSVTSMAASDQDVFICAADPSRGGYSIWRVSSDFDPESSELIMEGLRGCCGQMDIQCCGENLLISENTKFRVGIYDRNGRAQGHFGQRDRSSRAGFGGCCNPMNSMAMKDGSILIAESSIGHIKRFDTEGNLVAYVGKAAIGAGCKHCALGYDEQQDLYYMMYQDKNAICVLANNASTPMTLAEKQLEQRQDDFLVQATGQWSHRADPAAKTSSGLISLFGGGRGSSSQYPISSLELSADGSAKILEGMYKAYGDKSQFELLECPEGESDTVQFALTIDQMRLLEGTWKFDDPDTATLTFQGKSPITFARVAKDVDDSACAGEGCTNEGCEHSECPDAKPTTESVAAAKIARVSPLAPPPPMAPPKVIKRPSAPERSEIADYESSEDEMMMGIYDIETQIPKVTFEYKLLSKKDQGQKLQAKLNKMGADGWEFCGRVGKKMMFKRMSGFSMMEATEE